MAENKYAAIVLSAGSGKRMNSTVPKQYHMLEGRPVLCYSLAAFQRSMAEDIILVAGAGDVVYCQKEIVDAYKFDKVRAVIPGGKERYHSVFCGLKVLREQKNPPDYVMIHDGARPFITEEIILRCAAGAEAFGACAAGMPVKDTIKIVDSNQFATATPERKNVWMVQTPQVFRFTLIYDAYAKLLEQETQGMVRSVTDDAMVLELMQKEQVKLTEGSYQNIKITTPEDLEIAKVFCKNSITRSGRPE